MDTKESFRKAQKKALLAQQKAKFTRNFAVFKEVWRIICAKKAKNILLYLPLPYEVNLTRFRNKFAKKCKIFVPFMQDKSLKMVKLRMPFYKRQFGVYEPANSFVSAKIELAIVPVLGVDGDLKRIGHGFGFYDRFFNNLNYEPKLCFVSAHKAFCKQKFSDKHDIQADFYINPYEKFFYRKKNARSYNRSYRRCYRRWDRIFSC